MLACGYSRIFRAHMFFPPTSKKYLVKWGKRNVFGGEYLLTYGYHIPATFLLIRDNGMP